jgi:hypothetical protein
LYTSNIASASITAHTKTQARTNLVTTLHVCVCSAIFENPLFTLENDLRLDKLCNYIKLKYLAIADPVGSVNGLVVLDAELAITVPSTNGANPGRNL